MGGMPDTNTCYNGIEIWVELKVFVSGRTLIRPEQNAWLYRRHHAGGRVFVVSQHATGVHVWRPIFLTKPYGKYLQITSNPDLVTDNGKQLINFLFT
jgi:hypothetical protein